MSLEIVAGSEDKSVIGYNEIQACFYEATLSFLNNFGSPADEVYLLASGWVRILKKRWKESEMGGGTPISNLELECAKRAVKNFYDYCVGFCSNRLMTPEDDLKYFGKLANK